MGKNLLHIFKSGTHTAMSGQTVTLTDADLAASAAAYDPAISEAPIVVGHPKHDAPAYGWVQSLAASPDGLNAEPDQVDPAFAEMVAAGRFKKISASFYSPDSPNNPKPGVYYLRHVGFLGAQPPAVKGLKQVEFAEAAEGVVEFADWGEEATASLFRRMRDWMIGKFGLAEADSVLPDWQVQSIHDAAQIADAEGATAMPAFAEPTSQETTMTPEQIAAIQAENARLKQERDDANNARAADASKTRHATHVAFAEQLIAEGKLLPKNLEVAVAFMDFAESGEVLEFGEGDAKQPLVEAFRGFLSDMPVVVEFGEAATKTRAKTDANTPNPLLADAEARAAAAKR